MADLSQPLADFGQFGASLALRENTRFRDQRAVLTAFREPEGAEIGVLF